MERIACVRATLFLALLLPAGCNSAKDSGTSPTEDGNPAASSNDPSPGTSALLPDSVDDGSAEPERAASLSEDPTFSPSRSMRHFAPAMSDAIGPSDSIDSPSAEERTATIVEVFYATDRRPLGSTQATPGMLQHYGWTAFFGSLTLSLSLIHI